MQYFRSLEFLKSLKFLAGTSVIRVCSYVLIMLSIFLAAENIDNSTEKAKALELRTQQINYLEDRMQTLNLATEFGFDPLIVDVVRLSARDAFIRNQCGKCPTWRFIRSDRELSYVLLSIIAAESRGDFRAMGDSGRAHGLYQIWLSTARMYDRGITSKQLLTIPGNIRISVIHFVDLLRKYNGNHFHAVLAWNRGTAPVDRAVAMGNSPDNGYATKVFAQAALRNAQ